MARIFLSHSSKDNTEARALGDWLADNGWPSEDVFLDIDPVSGIAPGERWLRALNDAVERCEAVIFLISKDWLASRHCLDELSLAHRRNKRLIGVLIGDVKLDDIPSRLREEWQSSSDLISGRDGIRFDVELPNGAQGYATFSRAGLERLRLGLVKAGLDPSHFDWPPKSEPKRPPYRGLSAMEEEDAGIFYGREAATIGALDQLRGLSEVPPPRLLAILGASGSGKSSFMRAGLIPRLKRDEHHFLVLPIVRPKRAAISGDTGLVESLASAGEPLKWTRAQITKAIAAGAGEVEALIADLLSEVRRLRPGPLSRSPHMLLPIDQAEELFTADSGYEGQAFIELLAELMKRGTVTALVTIRTDSFGDMQNAEALTSIPQTTFSLPALARGAYQRVIEGPTKRLKGTAQALRLEPALTEALLADIEGGGAKDALPLLAFTMERLWREYGAKGELALADYRESGGVSGAIEAAVERALSATDQDPAVPREREARLALLRRAMIPWLAGIDPETNTARRQVALFSEIPDEAQPLIRHFIEQRLLATDVNEYGERTVEPAHEALLRQWGLIDGWLKEDIAVLATLEGVRRAARDWESNAHEPAWLAHSGARLEDAETVRTRADLARRLNDVDLKYLAACRTSENARTARELRSARLIRMAAVAASVLAIAAGAAAWLAWDRASEADRQRLAVSEQLAKAQISESRFLATRSGEAFRTGDSELAKLLAIAALPLDLEEGKRDRPLVDEAAAALTVATLADALKIAVTGYRTPPSALQHAPRQSLFFDANGTRLFGTSSGGTASVWDAGTGHRIKQFRGNGTIDAVASTPDGSRWAMMDSSGRLTIVDPPSLQVVTELDVGPTRTGLIALSSDGSTALAVMENFSVKVWDLVNSKLLAELTGHSGKIGAAAFNAAGSDIITGSEDGTARIWNSRTGETRFTLAHSSAVYRAEFTPAGELAVTGNLEHEVTIWNAATGGRQTSVSGILPAQAFINNSGTTLIATQAGPQSRLWSSGVGSPTNAISKMWQIYLQDNPGGIVDVFNALLERPEKTLTANDGWTIASAFSPNGSVYAAGSEKGTLRLWDLSQADKARVLRGHVGWLTSLVFSPKGDFIATAGNDGTLRIWKTDETGMEEGPFPEGGANQALAIAKTSLTRSLSATERAQYFLPPAEKRSLVPFNPSASECEQLASHPYDPAATSGANWDFDRKQAVQACTEALAGDIGNPRLNFLLGRSNQLAGDYEAALPLLQRAADSGYVMAFNNLASATLRGEGTASDPTKSADLFAEAFERGAYIAGSPLGELYWNGLGRPRDKAKAIKIWESAGAKGDPFSHEWLGWVKETGEDGSPPDPDAALYHYAVAVRLMEAAGDDLSANVTRYRRASLARVRDPETVANRWREAMNFKPTSQMVQ